MPFAGTVKSPHSLILRGDDHHLRGRAWIEWLSIGVTTATTQIATDTGIGATAIDASPVANNQLAGWSASGATHPYARHMSNIKPNVIVVISSTLIPTASDFVLGAVRIRGNDSADPL